MACELSANCNLILGILNCNLQEDTVDVDLKVNTLWDIHTYKKEWSTKVIKCSPLGKEVKPFLSLQKMIVESLWCRQIITSFFTNRSYQPLPKAKVTRRHNLVTFIRPNRKMLSQPREVNVGLLSKATQRNWIAMLKAKGVTGASQAPTPSQPIEASAIQSPT